MQLPVRKSFLTIGLMVCLCSAAVMLSESCRKNNPNQLTFLQPEVPAGFPQPLYAFQDNPLTEEGFQLGRHLFYDGRLSVDNLHPCSSCHQQIAGFGTYEHDRSHGVHDSHTLRNAPALFNLRWAPLFHWDGEFKTLKEEAQQPVIGPIEMGETWDGVISKIGKDPYYQQQFLKVFRTRFIRPEHILQALAQFTGSLISVNSKYDRVKKGTQQFSVAEQHGYDLYKTNCATCHPEPLFTDYSLRNNGIPVDPNLNDFGKMRLTGKSQDSLLFRVPSLRNVYISSNYMHDGRFNTLAQCINHYRTGIQQSTTLDPLLKNGIALTNAEATDLGLFLRALTDSSFLVDPRYTKPL